MNPGNPFLQRARSVARWGVAAGVLGGCGYYLATRTDRVALARALRSTDYLLVLAMTVGHVIVVLPIKAWRRGRRARAARAPRRRSTRGRRRHHLARGDLQRAGAGLAGTPVALGASAVCSRQRHLAPGRGG